MKGGGSGLVARPIFKIVMETPWAAPVGSIPTRSRHFFARLLLAAALAVAARPLAAQDSVATPADTLRADSVRADTVRRRGPSPTGALLKSLIVPGLGQITLGRELTAAVFVAFEGTAHAMVLKAQRDVDRAEAAGDLALAESRKRRREDWLVYMGINHVASALEAYVSANLWDFPGELQIRAAPGGGVGASASIPIRIR